MTVFRMAIPRTANFEALSIADAVKWLNGSGYGKPPDDGSFEIFIDDAALGYLRQGILFHI